MDDLEEIANRISFGGSYKMIDGNLYVLSDLTNDDRIFISFIISEAEKEAEASNLLSEKELYSILEEQGVWTQLHEKEIEGLKASIAELELEIKSGDISVHDRAKAKKLRGIMDRKLNDLLDKKSALFSTCDKHFVDSKKINALIYCTLSTETGERYWKNWSEFQETPADFVSKVSRALDFFPIEVSTYRKIARSNYWRTRWIGGGKNYLNLFGRIPGKLTQYQEMIVYWSQIYDSIYEAYERPSDEIIEDDEALDKWLMDKGKKDKQEKAASGKSSLPISRNTGRHSEIGIVVNKQVIGTTAFTNKDIKVPELTDVTDLNSDANKKFLQYQENKLKEKTMMSEESLRASKDARRIIGSNDAIVGKKRRADGHTTRTVQQILPGGTL